VDRSYEKSFLTNHNQFIIGVDEVGRGPLAGPVVAAAVMFDRHHVDYPPFIKDSKKLTPEKRTVAATYIKQNAMVSVAQASVLEIETLNILWASLLAMKRAVTKLMIKSAHHHNCIVLVDGNKQIPDVSYDQTAIIRGDDLCFSIAAASIVAKVARDRLMDVYHQWYPNYHFMNHKGYPTKYHLDMIQKIGITPIHRKTFRGVM